jgi:hypothetical protein
MPVLREGGMIGDIAVEPEPAEPPVRQIEVDLFAEAPLRADADAIPDDQHADHQLGIVLLNGSACGFRWQPFLALDALLPIGISLDQAGINRKAFAADQALFNEALQDRLDIDNDRVVDIDQIALHRSFRAHHQPDRQRGTLAQARLGVLLVALSSPIKGVYL